MKRSGIVGRAAWMWSAVILAGALAATPQSAPPSGQPAGKASAAELEAQSRSPKSAAPTKKSPAANPAAPQVKLAPQIPAGAPAKPYRFPKAATKTLANGLRVFVVSSSREPAITARLVLTTAGVVNDPVGKPGVAAMTANLLTQGTEKRTAQQIAQAIDFVGGTLTANADSDGAYVTVSVVKKDFDLAMDLLSDVALHAAFKQEELDRRRQQLLSNLSVEYADPDYLASAAFDRVVFGQHPYGLPTEGTPDSVRALTRDDLARFRDAYYLPHQALLAFAGDITPEAAFAAAEEYFAVWPKKDVPAAEPAPPQRPSGLRIFLIDKPDAVQTQIRAGRPGIRRNDPDYVPLFVTNRIFGGGYNSRLNTEVRQKKGLTYGANSTFDSRRLAGDFLTRTSTRTEATVEATKLIVNLIARMSAGDVKPEELDFARDYLAGVFPIQTETPQQVAGRLLTAAQYGLPADYYDTYQERIRSVTPEQVKAMAARYFNAADLDLVFAGNVTQFREALKKEFPTAKYEEIPFDQIDLLAADLHRPRETPAPASPEALERGKKILEAAAAAAGGEALNKIESVELSTSGKFFSPQGELPTSAKAWIVYPDHVRLDTTLPTFMIQRGSDGKSGWLVSPGGPIDLPPSYQAEFQRSIDLAGGWGLFRQALAGKAQAAFLGEEEFEGKKALAVEWNAGTEKVKLYFDPESHVLAGARYRQMTPQGISEMLQIWSDFRDVPGAGAKFPFHSINNRDGSKFTESTVSEIKVNSKPEPSLFTKPAK